MAVSLDFTFHLLSFIAVSTIIVNGKLRSFVLFPSEETFRVSSLCIFLITSLYLWRRS